MKKQPNQQDRGLCDRFYGTFYRALLWGTIACFSLSEGRTWAEDEPLQILTNAGMPCFRVELAQNPDQLRKGLMGRRFLKRNRGMLFILPQVAHVQFWMKNTYMPLDLLFIDAKGKIQHIHENAIPNSLSKLRSFSKVKAVLEVRAGTVKRFGIKAGDFVQHPLFGTKTKGCV